jgi:hypothetical protein
MVFPVELAGLFFCEYKSHDKGATAFMPRAPAAALACPLVRALQGIDDAMGFISEALIS